MLELDLCNLAAAEVEKIVASHCSRFGTVTNVSVRPPLAGSGDLVALVSMSTEEEFARVYAKYGDSKFGASVVIHIMQDAGAMAAAQSDAPPDDGADRAATVAGFTANRTKRGPADILLVEDNPADVRMTREALRAAGAPYHLHVVEDGMEAIAFLYKEGKYADVPRPDLVLLDLNIPKLNGQEVLLEIKSNDRFKHIPVVVLTSSRAERDIRASYMRNADCFVTKPVGLAAFAREIRLIETLLSR